MIIISGGEIITAIVVIVSVAFGIKYLIRLLNKKSNHIPKAVWETDSERFSIDTRLEERIFKGYRTPRWFNLRDISDDVSPEEYLRYFIKGMGYPKISTDDVDYRITHIGIQCGNIKIMFVADTREDFLMELYLKIKDYINNPDELAVDPIKEIVDRARGISNDGDAMERYGYKWGHL